MVDKNRETMCEERMLHFEENMKIERVPFLPSTSRKLPLVSTKTKDHHKMEAKVDIDMDVVAMPSDEDGDDPIDVTYS